MAKGRERSFPSRNNKPGESAGDMACPRCRKGQAKDLFCRLTNPTI